jgi:hypothetical protein
VSDALAALIWGVVALVGIGILTTISFLFLALFVALFDNRNMRYKQAQKVARRLEK